MLNEHVERYLALRNTLGYKLRDTRRELRAFASLAQTRDEAFITTQAASTWADLAPSAYARSNRMRKIILFAKFLHAEDERHEVPSIENYRYRYARPLPYIYAPSEVSQLLAATAKLKKQKLHRRQMYNVLIGLIATTGLRVSEALNLTLSDVEEDGVLRIRDTKFGKTRLVPLHPTTVTELDRYLCVRRNSTLNHNYLFVSRSEARLSAKTFNYTIHTLLKIAGIAQSRARKPRIHDLRHTFATRALEKCPTDRKSVEKHFVALSTYLGHIDVKATYWYLEATPDLMLDLAKAAERFAGGGA